MNRRSLFKGVLGLGAVAGLSLLPKVPKPEVVPEPELVPPVPLQPIYPPTFTWPSISPYTITTGAHTANANWNIDTNSGATTNVAGLRLTTLTPGSGSTFYLTPQDDVQYITFTSNNPPPTIIWTYS